MKIGVVSDTHIMSRDQSLPGQVIEGLEGVDLIIHAGDVAVEEVLDELSAIAPVKAVRGNVDPLKIDLPLREELNINNYRIGITHGHNLRGHIMEKIGYVFPETDIIIFGHTHIPLNQKIDGQLYFNPGSPTDRRLQDEYSFGIIKLGDTIESRIIKFS